MTPWAGHAARSTDSHDLQLDGSWMDDHPRSSSTRATCKLCCCSRYIRSHLRKLWHLHTCEHDYFGVRRHANRTRGWRVATRSMGGMRTPQQSDPSVRVILSYALQVGRHERF